jgi:phosphoglycerate dehydrogenase-like enzyme
MQREAKIAVCSKTFSTTPALISELEQCFSNIKLNKDRKLEADELASFIGDAEGAIVALERIDKKVLEQCSNLKVISKYGVGLDNIDFEACETRGVKVLYTKGVNKHSVAEMTIGFMIALSRNLFKTSALLKRGTWHRDGGVELGSMREYDCRDYRCR